MMVIDMIKYPVILFTDENVFVYPNVQHLTVANTSELKQERYKNALLVDSEYNAYLIKKAKKIKKLWKTYYHSDFLLRIFDYLFDPAYQVGLEFEDECPNISFEQIKEKVIAAISNNPDFWSSNHDVDKLINQVKRVDTLQRLFKLIQY